MPSLLDLGKLIVFLNILFLKSFLFDRFGKRSDSIMIQSKHPSLLGIINSNSVRSLSSGNEINTDDFYTFMRSNRRQR
jgi:hypothetical protein